MPPQKKVLSPLDLCHEARSIMEDIRTLKKKWLTLRFVAKEKSFMAIAERALNWIREARRTFKDDQEEASPSEPS